MSRQARRQSDVIPVTPVAENIKAAQAAKGYTNEELARKAGVSLRLLLKYRAGTVEPRFENVRRLGYALDKPPHFFYRQQKEAA